MNKNRHNMRGQINIDRDHETKKVYHSAGCFIIPTIVM